MVRVGQRVEGRKERERKRGWEGARRSERERELRRSFQVTLIRSGAVSLVRLPSKKKNYISLVAFRS